MKNAKLHRRGDRPDRACPALCNLGHVGAYGYHLTSVDSRVTCGRCLRIMRAAPRAVQP